MSKEIPDVMRRAINQLVLTQEFWASIVLSMPKVEVEDVPKMLVPLVGDFRAATDGERIYYSRKFIESLTPAVCTFVLAHEAAHGMLLHLDRIYQATGITVKGFSYQKDPLGRRLHRHPQLWNIAGDYVINLMLKESGFSLWKDCLIDDQYKGMSTEEVYKKLVENAKKCPTCGGSGKEQGNKGDKPCPSCGGSGRQGQDVGKSLIGGDLAMPEEGTNHHDREEEWKDRIVRAAAVAKSRGTVPSCIEEYIKEITEPQYPVWFLLEQYAESAIKSARDSSWKNPDRTMMPYGIIMPGDYDEKIPHVFLWYDTSGSVSQHELSRFHRIGGDIIRNLHPERLTIGQCDAGVHGEPIEVESESDWLTDIQCTGRGGTSFKPPFEWMAERGIEPSVMIYLTDLMGDFPTHAPAFPVLWVSTVQGNAAPFGDTIYLPPSTGEED